MKPYLILPLATAFFFGRSPAHAEDSACRPIINANKAQWQAPMVHDRKVIDSGFTMETIKLGDAMYMKTSGAWRTMSPAMIKAVTDFAAIEKAGLQLKNCKHVGTERIGPMPTRIYSFTTVASDAPGGSANGKVWIGSDGLPYQMEGNKVKGTMTYTNVTAPTVGK